MLVREENSRYWYENSVRRPRECPHITAPALANPAPHSSFRRRPESRGAGRWNQRHPSASSDGRPFSYLGVPAPAGISDWCENDVTRPRECPRTTAHALVNPTPHLSFRRRPESRRGGDGSTNVNQTLPATRTHFHTFVCRHQPARVIGTKMTLPALDRDFETHQSPQSSLPRTRESTHQCRAAKRQSKNRRESPQGQCSAGACPPLQAVRQPPRVPSHRRGDPPTAAPNLIHLCAGASRDERLQFLSNH